METPMEIEVSKGTLAKHKIKCPQIQRNKSPCVLQICHARIFWNISGKSRYVELTAEKRKNFIRFSFLPLQTLEEKQRSTRNSAS